MQKDGTIEGGGSWVYVLSVSLVAALGGLLFGYDTAVISGAIGFLQEFFELTPTMKGWVASSALLGCVIGAACAGTVSDRIGRKKMLLIASVCFLVSAIGSAMPRNLTEFVLYRILGGIGVGAASMMSPLYISEISPARIRGRMVSLNQLAIVGGILIVYFVNYFIEGYGTSISAEWNLERGWRWMFASEALPASLLLVLMFFVPESPRWLVKNGSEEKANKILCQVDGAAHAEAEIRAIRENLGQESGSIMQLFRPATLVQLMLIVGVALAVLQQVTGINSILYYGPEIFKDAPSLFGGEGSTMSAALLQTIGVGTANVLFTLIAIWTVDRFGRKPLMIIGSAGMGISITTLGFVFYYQIGGFWALACVLCYIASFALSLGPVTWVILSELFPTRIRGRVMAIATVFLWISCFLVSQTFPMLNDNAYLVEKFHHAVPYWGYGAFCLVSILFTIIFVPETKGRTLEEIEELWLEK